MIYDLSLISIKNVTYFLTFLLIFAENRKKAQPLLTFNTEPSVIALFSKSANTAKVVSQAIEQPLKQKKYYTWC